MNENENYINKFTEGNWSKMEVNLPSKEKCITIKEQFRFIYRWLDMKKIKTLVHGSKNEMQF